MNFETEATIVSEEAKRPRNRTQLRAGISRCKIVTIVRTAEAHPPDREENMKSYETNEMNKTNKTNSKTNKADNKSTNKTENRSENKYSQNNSCR